MSSSTLTPGLATAEGTARYRERFRGSLAEDHFRRSGDLWLSSIGIGTYLGEPTEADDRAYRDAVIEAVASGCNVIDTAVNYRCQRSERTVGLAMRELATRGFARDEIVVATKGGFIPFDGAFPPDPAEWFRSTLMEPGIVGRDDVVAGCHVMTPRYLEAQIAWSRENLGLASIDIYYLHNPETQLQEVERPEFFMRLTAAFRLLQDKVEEGVIGRYGAATWDGFRIPTDHPAHLSLKEMRAAAEQAAGAGNQFGAIQLPVNLIMPEASVSPTQVWDDGRSSLLDAAVAAGCIVMSSGSLLQGKVIEALAAGEPEWCPGASTSAQAGLQVIRSTPGIATALVGMRRIEHVKENLALAREPRLPGPDAARILRACSRD